MTVRPATADDLAAIVAIYNHEVASGVATFDTEPWTVEGQREWLAAHGAPARPLLAADAEGRVVGWACLSAWSTRCA